MTTPASGVLDLAALRDLSKEQRAAALRSLLSATERGLANALRAATDLRADHDGDVAGILAGDAHDRIMHRVHEHEVALEREQREAEEILERLMSHPAARRETMVRNSERLHTYSLCQLLHRESIRQLFRAPAEGLAVAKLAVEIADGSAISVPSETLRNDLRGRSWAFLGNAYRALSDFDSAEKAFARARKFLAEGTGDPLERAKLADFEGQLRLYQRRLPEAVRLLDRAMRTYLAAGDKHLAGGALVTKGVAFNRMGDIEGAIRLQRQALEMIDSARDARLQLAARHNLVANLVEAGHFQEAAAQVPALRQQHRSLGDAVTLIRLRAVEAMIASGLGDYERASEIYGEVRQQFVEHGLVIDVALVTLELAHVYLLLNRTQETKRLASESLPLFRSLGIHREAIAAFLVFQQAAEREAATIELVTEVAAYLRASRANPELKFRA